MNNQLLVRDTRHRPVARRIRPPASASVKSAQRALAIIELLTRTERPLTFRHLEETLRYPRSSLHGLLHTLLTGGWLELDDPSRTYTLGIRAWEAGKAYLRATSLAQRAMPYLSRVRDAMDETVQLAILDGRYNVYVAKVDGTQRLVLASEVGRRLEAHATGLGKVLLAGLPVAEIDRRLAGVSLERFTPNTIADIRALKRELDRTRRRGYGLDNEEYTMGVRCIAVPVRDHTGQVVAAMSVSVPTVRFDARRRRQALPLVQKAARDLSLALGYGPEPGA
jgi:DNA-binding IclR family transcriptional regulator